MINIIYKQHIKIYVLNKQPIEYDQTHAKNNNTETYKYTVYVKGIH